jgi:hypothetical protein
MLRCFYFLTMKAVAEAGAADGCEPRGADLTQDERIARRLMTKFGYIYLASAKKRVRLANIGLGLMGVNLETWRQGPLSRACS